MHVSMSLFFYISSKQKSEPRLPYSCNRTFVENREYVEGLVAVGTPWQRDFWRQEGLTESQKEGSKKVGRRP